MNFLNDFILLLKARYPIIYVSTYEEERIEYIIRLCCKKYVARTYYSWDFINGYQGNPNDSGFAAKNPIEALELVEKLTAETASVFVLKDYDNFLKDLCTPSEIQAMEERWEVAKLLYQGKLTYRDIASKLNTSTATVTRVARFLYKESNQGYLKVLKER